MGRIEGKVVLVTGAASGIGRASAARLAAEGAHVVGTDLQAPTVELDLPPGAEEVAFLPADVRDDAAVREVVAAVVDAYGRLDGVVQAAGVAGGGPIHLLEADEWDRVVGINLTGTYVVARRAVEQMMRQEPDAIGQRGSIVNLASVEGLEGTEGGSAYNASKGGVVILTKNLAIDYGHLGIRVNAICPGFIDTPMTLGVFGMPGLEGALEKIRAEHKLGRLGRPEEIASAALFLLSDDASFVTGTTLVVDGGYTAGRRYGVAELLGY